MRLISHLSGDTSSLSEVKERRAVFLKPYRAPNLPTPLAVTGRAPTQTDCAWLLRCHRYRATMYRYLFHQHRQVARLQYIRLYSNQNGDSSFEDLDIEQAVAASTAMASTTVAFRSFPPGWAGAQIVPDKRLLVFMLTGMVELTASDGGVRRVGPSDVVLVEDTWGKGHAARTVGDDATVQAFVQLTNAS